VTRRRSCACYAAEIGSEFILFDVGFGAMRRLVESGMDHTQIDRVILSHLHPDHINDLIPLVMALNFTPGFRREKDLILMGPPGFTSFYAEWARLMGEWALHPESFSIHLIDLAPGTTPMGRWTLLTRPMNHSRAANGYRIETPVGSLAYSGDTGPDDQVVELFKTVDFGILECSFPDSNGTDGHLTPSEAGKLAERAGCKRLLLTHFYPPMDQVNAVEQVEMHYRGWVRKAEDFMQISFPLSEPLNSRDVRRADPRAD
jgi:ribonuclease BN (tRNA processing enzyme)